MSMQRTLVVEIFKGIKLNTTTTTKFSNLKQVKID
uniref:Uncharacterized protein n=1 Tax=Arundo donax TaxID=35708 RepID=A0A0A9AQ82_ARUDO